MFKNLINLLFPKVCLGCKSFLLANENVICTSCRHEIPLTQHSKNPENEAFMKFYGRINVEYVATLMYYHKKGIVQEIIHSLKYRGHEEVGTVFGEWFAEDLKSSTIPQFDVIIPVPLHRKRLKSRGYNQITTFGEALSKNLEVSYNPKILQRNSYSKTQSKKNLLGRTEIKETTFDVTFNEKDHNKHFLLIDDVLTTGSTLEACGRALQKIPGARISVVCMAMSHS
ncbi:MAG: phosphoribosyltransferase family protein [Bacteroidota bacterium]